jgi:uncharacterized protein (DUF488 family)
LKIFTIGHSVQTIDEFIALAAKNTIDTIVDARSCPYSEFAPQFNREELSKALGFAEIKYIFMGDLLGARYQDKNLLFDNGKVDFKRVQQSLPFQNGTKRLKRGIEEGYKIALMCSERDPFNCHRFALVSEYLANIGIEVFHITPDKIYIQLELEDRLLKKYRRKISWIEIADSDIFPELAELIHAYKLYNEYIAYKEKKLENNNKAIKIAK